MMMGKWPAVLVSYDGPSRTAQISIPGMTDGGDTLLTAQLEYSLGDQSATTEYRILANSLVWVEFLGGDPRRPIVTGFRNPQVGNEVGTRYWSQVNFDVEADSNVLINAGSQIVFKVGDSTLTITSSGITLQTPQTTMTGKTTSEGLLTFEAGMNGSGGSGGGATMQIAGGANFTEDVVANGKSVSGHEHTSEAPGTPTSPPI